MSSSIQQIAFSEEELGDDIQQVLLGASTRDLLDAACRKRDDHYGNLITYSRKVFIPLIKLCRDVCSYCTFSKVKASERTNPFLSLDEVLSIVNKGAQLGCHEALFTLGDQPELRYPQARDHLDRLGFSSTLSYLEFVSLHVLEQGKLLPHLNPGVMTLDTITRLKKVSVSMGLMLETSSKRLSEVGQVHYGCPDKDPDLRLKTIEYAGMQAVPFSSGVLIGIGETRSERIESLIRLRNVHLLYGHLQEVIVQNFCPKPNTKMAMKPPAPLEEHLWTIAVARLILPGDVSIQAPPNLSPKRLINLIQAGINDWGGVSPLTPDYVNPELPWPEILKLSEVTHATGRTLVERLAAYPSYVKDSARWFSANVQSRVLYHCDSAGLARDEKWIAGVGSWNTDDLVDCRSSIAPRPRSVAFISPLLKLLDRLSSGHRASPKEIIQLFEARGTGFDSICRSADELRQEMVGSTVTYVVNRNINYTNICGFACGFCSFAKGGGGYEQREKPYLRSIDEIVSLSQEAFESGATEVCMQGGIHPSFTGDTYLTICQSVKSNIPSLHIHAFSPLEINHGAKANGLSLEDFLSQLKASGLATLPGTAAEILVDSVRRVICPDKLTSEQWLSTMRTAHKLGIRSTATIMFGHVEGYLDWAEHLLKIRDLQEETGGFTEFVPLPFVHVNTPLFRRGISRKGPSFREAILMHAVGRLVLSPHFKNIQVSWVKMGAEGVLKSLSAGVNDLGGTLMNESISRAAGASYGQSRSREDFLFLAQKAGRGLEQRTTLYMTHQSSSTISNRSELRVRGLPSIPIVVGS